MIVEPPSAADEAIDSGTPVALDTSTVEEHDWDEEDGDCAGEPTKKEVRRKRENEIGLVSEFREEDKYIKDFRELK